MVLNYYEHLFILVYMTTSHVLISAFPLLVGTPIGIASFEVGLKNSYKKKNRKSMIK